MSTALFFKIKNPVNCSLLKNINEIIKKNGIFDEVAFRYKSIEKKQYRNYYFDSMWVPFSKPLIEFSNETIILIFKTVKEIIEYLVNEKEEIELFLASVEEINNCDYSCKKINISCINEYMKFEWGTIYKLYS